jgi:F0F1-type ATP synthase membrane subunit b/b'
VTDRATLITGWINFAILVGVLSLFLRPLLRHFFFERRNRIKKYIAKSVDALDLARERARKARDLDAALDDDIEERRLAIEKTCDKECESIVNEARNKQHHILDNAAKGSEVERRKAVEMVRVHMLDAAFDRARDIFLEGVSEEKSKAIIDKGFEELVEKKPFAQASSGEAGAG